MDKIYSNLKYLSKHIDKEFCNNFDIEEFQLKIENSINSLSEELLKNITNIELICDNLIAIKNISNLIDFN